METVYSRRNLIECNFSFLGKLEIFFIQFDYFVIFNFYYFFFFFLINVKNNILSIIYLFDKAFGQKPDMKIFKYKIPNKKKLKKIAINHKV